MADDLRLLRVVDRAEAGVGDPIELMTELLASMVDTLALIEDSDKEWDFR